MMSATGSKIMVMRRVFGVAVAVVLVSVAAQAQHGGGEHGGGGGFHGGGGGFANHGAGGMHVGSAAGGYSQPAARVGGSYGARPQGVRVARGGWTAGAGGRPEFYHREGDRGRYDRRGYGVGYGVGVGYDDYGWLDANDPGYDAGYDSGDGGVYDAGPVDDGAYAGGPQAGPEQDGYPGGYAGQDQAEGGEPPVPYTSGNDGGVRGRSARIERRAAPSQLTMPTMDPVTLVFKDGHGPETIHNYAMTRTTLYVTDGKRREIPVASLDLAATERVNRAAGVRFELPVAAP